MVRIIGSGVREVALTDRDFRDLAFLLRKLSPAQIEQVVTGAFKGSYGHGCVEVESRQ